MSGRGRVLQDWRLDMSSLAHGGARLILHHGGESNAIDLTADERRALGTWLLNEAAEPATVATVERPGGTT